jgi:predicted nuclease of predicted toxin-antitoxin system
MGVRLYMDVHVPQPTTDQLRRRGVDVLTAVEDGLGDRPDDELLKRAMALGRVTFTQDIRFKVLAERWQHEGRPLVGLLFGHQLRSTIGQYVRDLELVAGASEPQE